MPTSPLLSIQPPIIAHRALDRCSFLRRPYQSGIQPEKAENGNRPGLPTVSTSFGNGLTDPDNSSEKPRILASRTFSLLDRSLNPVHTIAGTSARIRSNPLEKAMPFIWRASRQSFLPATRQPAGTENDFLPPHHLSVVPGPVHAIFSGKTAGQGAGHAPERHSQHSNAQPAAIRTTVSRSRRGRVVSTTARQGGRFYQTRRHMGHEAGCSYSGRTTSS